ADCLRPQVDPRSELERRCGAAPAGRAGPVRNRARLRGDGPRAGHEARPAARRREDRAAEHPRRAARRTRRHAPAAAAAGIAARAPTAAEAAVPRDTAVNTTRASALRGRGAHRPACVQVLVLLAGSLPAQGTAGAPLAVVLQRLRGSPAEVAWAGDQIGGHRL